MVTSQAAPTLGSMGGTGSAQLASARLPSRAAANGSASSSPEPEENYPGMANGVGGMGDTAAAARVARYESLSGAPFDDPHETGSFPSRPPQSWTEAPTMAVMPEPRDEGQAPRDGAVFGWVPASAMETGHYVRPKTAELPVRTETSTLLELFDNPELELKTPAVRGEGGGVGGGSGRLPYRLPHTIHPPHHPFPNAAFLTTLKPSSTLAVSRLSNHRCLTIYAPHLHSVLVHNRRLNRVYAHTHTHTPVCVPQS